MRGRFLWPLVLLVTLAFSLILVADQADLQQVRGVNAHDGDTIWVEFPDGHRDDVRYASINAPGLDQCFGPEAQQCNERLIKGKDLWLELDPTDGDYRRTHDRLLAHVFLNPERSQTSSVEVQLVAQGCARLDVIDPNDTGIRNGQDFDVRYTDWIIAAQTEAAKARRGWWGKCDEYAVPENSDEPDVIIAAIKQWSEDEIVYIVNRGESPINLGDSWLLHDKDQKHVLKFEEHFPPGCSLPSGGVLRIHSGPFATDKKDQPINCDQEIIDLYWTGHKVWDNRGDEAWLYRPDDSLAYYYYYPLDWN